MRRRYDVACRVGMCKPMLDVPAAAINYVYSSLWRVTKGVFTIYGPARS